MGLSDFFKNFPTLARQAAQEDGRIPEIDQPPAPILRRDLSTLDDAQLIDIARRYMHTHEDLAVAAISKVKKQMRLRLIAMDPDMTDVVRMCAIGRLREDSDETCAMIARADHNPVIAHFAASNIKSRRWLETCQDIRHEVTRAFVQMKLALTH